MVKGTASQDFCYSCCCNALALAQEARHLDANAYKVVVYALSFLMPSLLMTFVQKIEGRGSTV